MMKYRMVIHANQNEMFEVFQENFLNEYFVEKGKLLPVEKLIKGFSFQKNVAKDKRKGHIRLATVKILDYQYPSVYRVEYISDRYRKITGVNLKQLDEKRLEIITEEVLEKAVMNENGKTEYISEIKESNQIKNASWWKKVQYKYLARSIELRKKANKS